MSKNCTFCALPHDLWQHILVLAWGEAFAQGGAGSVLAFASEFCASRGGKQGDNTVGAAAMLRPLLFYRALQATKAQRALCDAGVPDELFFRLQALCNTCLDAWTPFGPRMCTQAHCPCRASFEANYHLAYKATLQGAGRALRDAALACALLVAEKRCLTSSERTKRCSRIADVVLFNEKVWSRPRGLPPIMEVVRPVL